MHDIDLDTQEKYRDWEVLEHLQGLFTGLDAVLANPIDAEKPEPVYVWASHMTLETYVVRLPINECLTLARYDEALHCGDSFTEAAEQTQNNIQHLLNDGLSCDFVVMCAVHTAEYLIERNASK